jgi:hypothetical protein
MKLVVNPGIPSLFSEASSDEGTGSCNPGTDNPDFGNIFVDIAQI